MSTKKQVSCSGKRAKQGCPPPEIPVFRKGEKVTDYHKRLIDYYKANLKVVDPVMRFFKDQPNLNAAIRAAAVSRDGNGKKLRHQWRIADSILKDFGNKLVAKAAQIKTLKTFAELYGLLETVGAPIDRIGELAVYDVARRIGYYLAPKLEPKDVYLHAGTLTGIRIVMPNFRQKITKGVPGLVISKKYLPEPFCSCRLSCAELEDFFCAYEGNLKR